MFCMLFLVFHRDKWRFLFIAPQISVDSVDYGLHFFLSCLPWSCVGVEAEAGLYACLDDYGLLSFGELALDKTRTDFCSERLGSLYFVLQVDYRAHPAAMHTHLIRLRVTKYEFFLVALVLLEKADCSFYLFRPLLQFCSGSNDSGIVPE